MPNELIPDEIDSREIPPGFVDFKIEVNKPVGFFLEIIDTKATESDKRRIFQPFFCMTLGDMTGFSIMYSDWYGTLVGSYPKSFRLATAGITANGRTEARFSVYKAVSGDEVQFRAFQLIPNCEIQISVFDQQWKTAAYGSMTDTLATIKLTW
ncbi:hypothetical protein [Gimesia chilikensis]|uniref:Uncharacterized protein n=1 Tax=Gimesia chilikensis TaxID=2605989 RepID=A0A517PYD7_9PLAN|nr:hypothetical protein [Gimesia chilikensis]QDT24379.1 hypothetical protein HG66A1_62110 [Gimesia chilikensis]